MDTMKAINAMISANDAAKETAIENDIVEILNTIVASEAPGIFRICKDRKKNYCYEIQQSRL